MESSLCCGKTLKEVLKQVSKNFEGVDFKTKSEVSAHLDKLSQEMDDDDCGDQLSVDLHEITVD